MTSCMKPSGFSKLGNIINQAVRSPKFRRRANSEKEEQQENGENDSIQWHFSQVKGSGDVDVTEGRITNYYIYYFL